MSKTVDGNRIRKQHNSNKVTQNFNSIRQDKRKNGACKIRTK